MPATVTPPPVVLILGDVGLLVDRAVAELEASVMPHVGIPAFNVGTWRGDDNDVMGALRAARTLPMMADRRLVIVRGVENAGESWLEAATEYAREPNASTTLVIAGTGFAKPKKGEGDHGARLRNAVKKSGEVMTFKSEDQRPSSFAVAHATRLGKRLGAREAELLVEVVGGELGTLAVELEKLSLYLGDREEITAADIDEACSLLAEQVVWELTAGIAARDASRAHAALFRLLDQDDSSGQVRRLLGMIAWQTRQVIEVAAAIREGLSDWEVRQRTKARAELVVAVRGGLQRGLPPTWAMLDGLAEANRLMNSHRAGDRRILEDLVSDLCGLGR